MSNEVKNMMREVMNLAWQFVRKNGMSLSNALRIAWCNIKLKMALKKKIVKFYFVKVDGTLREAYGTLKENLVPKTKGIRRNVVTCQTYFDTEKSEWRCFKKANLVKF